MNILFAKNISVHDYFSFFLEFMADDLKIEKDLGTNSLTQGNGTKFIFWDWKGRSTR